MSKYEFVETDLSVVLLKRYHDDSEFGDVLDDKDKEFIDNGINGALMYEHPKYGKGYLMIKDSDGKTTFAKIKLFGRPEIENESQEDNKEEYRRYEQESTAT